MTMHAAKQVNELQELSLNKQLYAAYHGYEFYFALSDEWEGFFPLGGLGRLFAHRERRSDQSEDYMPGEFVKVIGIWETMRMHPHTDWLFFCDGDTWINPLHFHTPLSTLLDKVPKDKVGLHCASQRLSLRSLRPDFCPVISF
jgi:hypothetical protein